MRLVLFGPPGVGKGTQGERLASELGVIQAATGDMLRAAVSAGTQLGKQARTYMDAGKLVPDAVVVGLIEERISQKDAAHGFLLDGFPRNLAQAEALDAMLQHRDMQLERVVFMRAEEAALIERLSGRLLCRACGFGFHRHYSPPRDEGHCDRCGGELYQRDDDRESVITSRLEVYREQTEPLRSHYADHPGFREIDGGEAIDEVYENLKKAVLN
ncbi:MAG: adenylate kinase [Mariprofundaceae bacterium]